MTKIVPGRARALLQEHNNTQAAAAALEAEALTNPDLFQELTKHALRDACLTAVRRIQTNDRANVWKERAASHALPPLPNPTPIASAPIASIAAAVGRSLLNDYRLPGGMSLGDATRAQLTEAVHVLEERASDMAGKAQWLRLIANAMSNDTVRVRDEMSEDRVHAIQASVLGTSPQAMTAAA